MHKQVRSYFLSFESIDIFNHTLEVVAEVCKIADHLDLNKEKCIIAAYLHDVGRVVEKEDLVLLCKSFGEIVMEDEERFPFILHQKGSRVIAENLFEVKDIEILNAIECHTTLKSSPTDIDIAVFLADKLTWKEAEHQNLIEKMKSELLEGSKENAALYYLNDLYSKRDTMKYYHPWAKEAYLYLNNGMGF